MSSAVQPKHSNVPPTDEAPAWKKALPVVLIVLILVAAGYGLSKMMGSGGGGGKKQNVKIALLPDTPPPSPPPPKEEKKPEPPKEEPKQTMQQEQPKVAEAPPQQAQALKMEGAAGDGPSAFQQGAVTNDYDNGPLVTGGSTSAPSTQDRAKFSMYANSARQMLKAELDKSLPPEVMNMGARLRIWIDPNGGIGRYQVLGLNDKAAQDKLDAAMAQASRSYRLLAPAGMPQPLELKLSVNPVNG